MAQTEILRTRVDSTRKKRVERILHELGLTPAQAVNLFFAQIELRRSIPFPLSVESGSDILPPIQQVAKLWENLDSEDFSGLDPR